MSDYKLTIYADKEGPFGHFSVGVSGPDIDEPLSGKYLRDETVSGKVGAVTGGAPGAVRDDSDRKGKTTVIERSIPLTKAQAKKAAAYVANARANPDEYELFGKNCIDLAQGVLDASGAETRIDKMFTGDELDELGNPIYGVGDLAQRRGHLQDIEKIVSETRPGAERRKAIRDYWRHGGELPPENGNAPKTEPGEVVGAPGDADAAAPGSTSDSDADREQDDDVRNASKGADHADASSPDAAKMKAALMPSEKDDDWTRRDELLFKSATS